DRWSIGAGQAVPARDLHAPAAPVGRPGQPDVPSPGRPQDVPRGGVAQRRGATKRQPMHVRGPRRRPATVAVTPGLDAGRHAEMYSPGPGGGAAEDRGHLPGRPARRPWRLDRATSCPLKGNFGYNVAMVPSDRITPHFWKGGIDAITL